MRDRSVLARLAPLAALAALAAPSVARAEAEGAPRRVVVLLEPGEASGRAAWVEAEARIAAELAAAGYEVAELPGPAEGGVPGVSDLARACRERDAAAGLVALRSEADAEVLVWVDGRARRRLLGSADLAAPDAVAEVALSVVELLHACGLDLGALSPPGEAAPTSTWEALPPSQPADRGCGPAPETPAPAAGERAEAGPPPLPLLPPPAPRWAPRRRLQRWSLRGGLAVPVAVDPATVMLALSIAGGLRVLEWLAVDLEAQVTVGPLRFRWESGEASVFTSTVRGHLLFEPWPRAAGRLGLGVGGGLLVAWNGGAADPASSCSGDAVATGLVSFLARLAFPVTASLRVVVAAAVGLALPEVTLRYEGSTIGSLGFPLLDVTLAVEWGLSPFTARDS